MFYLKVTRDELQRDVQRKRDRFTLSTNHDRASHYFTRLGAAAERHRALTMGREAWTLPEDSPFLAHPPTGEEIGVVACACDPESLK